MGKFLLGFVIGAGIGAGIAILLTPEPGAVSRERLREKSDLYAAGAETPVGTVANVVQKQRNRLEEAVEVGRRASAERQADLWARLNLAPPNETPPISPPLT